MKQIALEPWEVVVFTGVDRFRAAWRHGQPGPIPSTSTSAIAAASSLAPADVVEGAAAIGAVGVGVHATPTARSGKCPPSTSAGVPKGTAEPAAPTTSKTPGVSAPRASNSAASHAAEGV